LGQRILEISAQILPLLAAFGLIASIARFAFLVIVGGIVKLITPFITLATVIFNAHKAFMGLKIVMLLGAGPVLAIVAGIAALVAIVVLLFTKSEKLREAFMLLVDGALAAVKGAFNDVMGAIDSIMPSIRSVGELFESVGNFLAVTLVPVLSFILVRAIGVLSGAIQKVIYVIGGIIEAFKAVWYFVKGIFQLLTGNTEGAADSMKKSFSAAFSAIKNVIKSIVSPFVGVLNAISDAWNNTVGKFDFKVPSWVPIIGGKTFNVPNLPRINLANFAEGGTVFPQTGGVIARVAEAGRPERIEPLDPEGLSVRDRAIIDRLSGGGGKGVTVNVYPSEGMDERELAAIVSRQIAFATRRGAA
jgi:phage-related protein